MKSLYFIFYAIALLLSCEENATEKSITREQEEVRVISPPDSIPVKKYPCEKWPVITRTFLLNNGKIKISVSTNCLNDYNIVDTAVFPDNGRQEIMLNSNYETSVTFDINGEKRTVSITKDLVAAKDINNNLIAYKDSGFIKTVVFVNPTIIDFNAMDTAVLLSQLLGPPNSDNAIMVKYKVYFNGEKDVIAFEEPEF